jgi:Flp pilus assembly protein TadB
VAIGWCVAVLGAVSCWLFTAGGRPAASRRLKGLNQPSAVVPLPPSDPSPSSAATVTVAVVVGVVVALRSSPLAGCALGAALAFARLRWSGRRAPWRPGRAVASTRAPARRWAAVQLPAALDLLAACLAAGAPPERALASVGDAFGGELGQAFVAVARLATLGAPVETAWAQCLADTRLSPVARAVIRAHYSGAALGDVLTRLADDRRRALRSAAEAAAQRAGVRAVLPLGLCFLPAFILVGVVPVVAGFAGTFWR